MRRLLVGLSLLIAAVVGLIVLRRPVPVATAVATVSAAAAPIPASATPSAPTAVCAPGTPGAAFAASVPAGRARKTALGRAAAFADWLVAWRRAAATAQPALAADGRRLAADRRAALAYLIQTDPERALAAAVPAGLRAGLPADIAALLEDRIDARGDFEVIAGCFGDTPLLDRFVQAGGARYQAFVYGRRLDQPTKLGLPVHGIAVDGVLALADTPFRLLDDAEKAARSLPPAALAVLVGAEVRTLADPSELAVLRAQLVGAESQTGPEVRAFTTDPAATESPSSGLTAAALPSGWTVGEKRVLFIRVDFSDAPGSPSTVTQINDALASSNTFYQNVSNGRCSLATTIFPEVLRMPNPKTFYEADANSYVAISNEARAQARAYDTAHGGTGIHNPDTYDRWIVLYAALKNHSYGGRGNVGAAGIWLNGYLGATTHELGHNHGLQHSHSWDASGASPIAANGKHTEYGDIYDVMGGGSDSYGYFADPQKEILGYLDSSTITTVSSASTIRLYRQDDRNAAGIQALKIPVGASYDYWVETRRLGPGYFNSTQLNRLRNGVLLHWGKRPAFTAGPGIYLLDMNPATAGDMNDAPLPLGQTFTDPDAGIHVTPLATGGVAPREYIDVRVDFGAIGSNHNPAVSSAPPASAQARTDLTFSATGTDPDGDTLYYRWDFGDNVVNPTTATVSHRWLKGGAYNVSVSALDGKGGIATRSYAVDVADPLLTWTRRDGGLTNSSLISAIFADGKFLAGGYSGTLLSSADGVVWSRQPPLANGMHIRGIAHDGARFVLAGSIYQGSAYTAASAWSADGAIWQFGAFPAAAAELNAVAAGAGRFVAVGTGGKIYTSTDGAAWAASASPTTTPLRAIAFGAGKFVAVGDSGVILSSADGLAWTNVSPATTAYFTGVIRAGSTWLASNGYDVWRSADAVTWTRAASQPGTSTLGLIATADGLLLSSGYNSKLAFAENETAWEVVSVDGRPSTAYVTYNALAEGNGLLVTVNSQGEIYTSGTPRALAPRFADATTAADLNAGTINLLSAVAPGYTSVELFVGGRKVASASSGSPLAWAPPFFGTYSLELRGILPDGSSVRSFPVVATAGLASWTWSNPRPVGVNFTDGVRVNGLWYLTAQSGGIYTLNGAGTFRQLPLHTRQSFARIAFAAGRWVAVGSGYDFASRSQLGTSAIWTSTDGTTWTPWADGTYRYFYGLAYGAGKWAAVGQYGQIVTSTDGVTWTAQTSGVTTGLFGLAYANGLWTAVGDGGVILTSPDATVWTARASGSTRSLRGVTFGRGKWIAVGSNGEMLVSADASAWTRATATTELLNGVGLVRDTFVAYGYNGTVLVSTDGASWTAAATGGRRSIFDGLAIDGNDSLLLGRYGDLLASATAANTWSPLSADGRDNLNGLVWGGGRFVAVTQGYDWSVGAWVGAILTSTDGAAWTRWTPPPSTFYSFQAVAYGQQKFVAVGGGGRIYTSPDGTAWTARTSGTSDQFNGAASNASGHVAAGYNGIIASSADGTTWNLRSSGTTAALNAAAASPGGFVVVGDSGTILTSADGIAWTARSSGTTRTLRSAAWTTRAGFLVGGDNGILLRSPDGVAWTPVAITATDTVFAIGETDLGLVVAAGFNGYLTFSSDGVTWADGFVPMPAPIRGLAGNATTALAVSDGGAILAHTLTSGTAPVVTEPPLSQSAAPGSGVTLSASATDVSGATYQWLRNGASVSGGNADTLTLANVQPAHAGLYSLAIAGPSGSTESAPAIFGLLTSAKVVGAGEELSPTDIRHPNGNIFDQVLLTGAAETITADTGQVTRTSFIDLDDDIVQVEFAGPGSLSVVLTSPTGPAYPANYSQAVNYMKGHAGIVIVGADERTNVSVFSVGRLTAFDPSGHFNILQPISATNDPATNGSSLFSGRGATHYDGFADLAFIAILTTNGKFGGVRTANATYFADRGYTGLYAPGVQFTGPVYLGDISAADTATPVIVLGSAADTRITGGSLSQLNARAVQVSGLTQLKFVGGIDSHGNLIPAQQNHARLEQNGADVTSQIVVNPP